MEALNKALENGVQLLTVVEMRRGGRMLAFLAPSADIAEQVVDHATGGDDDAVNIELYILSAVFESATGATATEALANLNTKLKSFPRAMEHIRRTLLGDLIIECTLHKGHVEPMSQKLRNEIAGYAALRGVSL